MKTLKRLNQHMCEGHLETDSVVPEVRDNPFFDLYAPAPDICFFLFWG